MRKIPSLANRIVDGFTPHGSPARAVAEKAYLKSELDHLGVGVPKVRSVVRAAAKAQPELAHDELITAVETLWKQRLHEARLAAVELLCEHGDLLGAADLALVETMIRGAHTWAFVDPLATAVTGDLVERFPALTRSLDRWSRDDEFWIRRAAMLALLVPMRRGAGDFARFARYADAMLDEKEFFIRKAIGWVLREVAHKRPALVFDWLEPRAQRASGVTMREAVKYLTATQRATLVTKKAAGRARSSPRRS